MNGSNRYFTETQRFRQPWLWLIIVAVDVLIISGILSEMQKTKSDAHTKLIFAATIESLIVVLFLILRLDTKITAEGINYRFYPFQRFKVIKWEEISSAHVRTYKPLGEYGGWGVRFGLRGTGMAYNVSGSQGLQLQLTNGKKILLGTQRPQELERVLIQLNKNSSGRGHL
jgi:hypothetical protein